VQARAIEKLFALFDAHLTGLLNNARVVRHLAQFHADLLQEFQKIAEVQKAA